jgi:cell division protein FtsB
MSVKAAKNSRSISQFLATFLSFGLFVYFFYHLVHGDHGYFAWKGVEEKLIVAQVDYDKSRAERDSLEKRVRMLRPDSLDLDMLDERTRAVLGFMNPDEVVVVDKAL